MTTEVNNETETEIDGAEFAALADHVLASLHVNPGAELSILFIDPSPWPSSTSDGWTCPARRTS